MNKDVDNLKVVKIVNAIYCVRCNFAYVADVLLTDGNRKKMFYCSRRDCDNWVSEDMPVPTRSEAGHSWDTTLLDDDEPIADGWED